MPPATVITTVLVYDEYRGNVATGTPFTQVRKTAFRSFGLSSTIRSISRETIALRTPVLNSVLIDRGLMRPALSLRLILESIEP